MQMMSRPNETLERYAAHLGRNSSHLETRDPQEGLVSNSIGAESDDGPIETDEHGELHGTTAIRGNGKRANASAVTPTQTNPARRAEGVPLASGRLVGLLGTSSVIATFADQSDANFKMVSVAPAE